MSVAVSPRFISPAFFLWRRHMEAENILLKAEIKSLKREMAVLRQVKAFFLCLHEKLRVLEARRLPMPCSFQMIC